MKPSHFLEANAEATGKFIVDNDGPFEPIPVCVGKENVNGKEESYILSVWKPTEKEIQDLVKGGSIYLILVGVHLMPRLGIGTENPFGEESDEMNNFINSFL